MISRRFFSFFPPPRIMTMPHSGVSLSDDGIRTVAFNRIGNHVSVAHYSFEPLSGDIIVGGKIEKAPELIEALKKVQKRHGITFVAGSIPDEKAYIFTLTIQYQKGMDIRDAVAFRIPELVPIALVDAIFDFTITHQGSDSVEVVVRVVHQKTVDAYLEVFKGAHMEPLLFKVASQAIADAALDMHDSGPHILIFIEQNKTLCTLLEKQTIQFSTVVDIGTNSFIEALQKSLNIEAVPARAIITGGNTERSREDVLFAVGNVMSIIRDEIVKLEEYWIHKNPANHAIEHLTVGGIPSSLPGFVEYLEQGTGLKTFRTNVWGNALPPNHKVPPIPQEEAPAYASAIGLALPAVLHL